MSGLLLSVSSPDRALVRAEAALALATLFDALGTPLESEPLERGNGLFAAELAKRQVRCPSGAGYRRHGELRVLVW
jgi:hypothetical protein